MNHNFRFQWQSNLLLALMLGSATSSQAGDLDLFLATQGRQGAPNVVIRADGPGGPARRAETGPVGPNVVPPVVGFESGAFRSSDVGSSSTNLDAKILSGVAPSAPTESGGACVIGGTPIRMADGTYRKIEELQAGDLVAGLNDSANEVVEVLEWHLGRARLFSINGSPPFITADHAILTPDGWKSFDPLTTREGLEFMTFGLLTEGDTMLTGSGPVTLQRAESVSAHPNTTVYLPLVTGDKTFQPFGIVAMAAIGPAEAGFFEAAA